MILQFMYKNLSMFYHCVSHHGDPHVLHTLNEVLHRTSIPLQLTNPAQSLHIKVSVHCGLYKIEKKKDAQQNL